MTEITTPKMVKIITDVSNVEVKIYYSGILKINHVPSVVILWSNLVIMYCCGIDILVVNSIISIKLNHLSIQ